MMILSLLSKNKITLVILSIIFFIFIFLRLYQFHEYVMFLSDQGRDALIIRKILTFENWPLIGAPSSIGQVYLGPFYYYLISPFLLFLNWDPSGLAFGVFLYALIGTIFLFKFVSRYHDEASALILVTLISTSSVLIHFSRFSWNPNLLPYFGFFSIYSFYNWLKKPSLKNGFIFGVSVGLTIQLHYLAIFLFAPFTLYYTYLLVKKFDIKRVKSLTAPSISFLATLTPLFLFDLRHDFLNFNQLYKYLSGNGLKGEANFFYNLETTSSGFLNSIFPNQLSNNYALIITLLLIFFWVLIAKKINSNLFTISLLTVTSYLILFSLIESARHTHYYGPVIILTLYLIVISFSKIKPKLIKFSIYFVLTIIFLYTNYSRYYFFQGKDEGQIAHAKKVANFITQKIDGKPFNIATWPVDFGEDSYLYFMDLNGDRPADRAKLEVTNQMFVICNAKICPVIDSPSWNISMFKPTKIENTWEIENLKILKLTNQIN